MTLVERLEAATAGSRELDALIFTAVTGKRAQYETRGFSGAIVTKTIQGLPHYTTSIDAALTLVPDGFDYIVYCIDGECYAEVGPTGSFGFTKCVGAATIVLALCVAALKARTP